MVAVIASEFLADVRFRSFSQFAESEIDSILELVEANYCPATAWDLDRQVEGIKLRTAHELAMNLMQEANLAAIGQAISAGQAPPSLPAESDSLDATYWGREFKRLRSNNPNSTGFSLYTNNTVY